MSSISGPSPYPPPPPRGPSLLGCAFAFSVVGNFLALVVIVILCTGLIMQSSAETTSTGSLSERHYAGSKSAKNRIAIVSLEGVIMEGMLDHVHKQLDQAGKDETVKATVIRVNSPGGSITASDDLYRRILRLKNGDEEKKIAARPIVVSMGSIAASGGYFIAAPANRIFAERSTLTGSIGVYASFPSVKELASKVGVDMRTIKAGAIKDSGSMFKDLTGTERQMMQDMVNDAYDQFLEIVEKGRPALTRKRLLERFQVTPLQPDPVAQKADGQAATPYPRYRADGGIFSAPKAKELGLIDDIGPLEEAVKAAAELANLESYHAFRYLRPRTLSDMLIGLSEGRANRSPDLLDPEHLRSLLTPRIMYLAPGYEMSGLGIKQGS